LPDVQELIRQEIQRGTIRASAHLPDVQELIRQEIQRGTIRVRPKTGGGIRIVPVGIPENEQLEEMEPLPVPSQEEASPTRRVTRRGRLAHS
jgi:hypothetical protein